MEITYMFSLACFVSFVITIKYFRSAAILLALLLLFGLVPNLHAEAEIEIRVSYENTIQFPYYMGDDWVIPVEKPGLAVEMVQMLGKKVSGLKVTLKRYPWSRCLFMLEHGKVDGIFNGSFKPERLKIGAYPLKKGIVDSSRRITDIAYFLYKLKDSKLDWDGKVFSNLNGMIGAPFGYSIIGDLEKMGIKVDAVGNTEKNLDKLVKNRLAGGAFQDVTADFHLRTKPDKYKDVVKIFPPIKTKAYYLMLSHQFTKKYPELSEQIWDAIGEIRETEFEKLSEKYFE